MARKRYSAYSPGELRDEVAAIIERAAAGHFDLKDADIMRLAKALAGYVADVADAAFEAGFERGEESGPES